MNDITQASRLVACGTEGKGVVGDRAYDSNAFLEHLARRGLEAVIPSRANRLTPRPIASDAYRGRNVIERWFGRLKVFRRIATRYDKTARSYAGFVEFGTSIIALSGWGL